MPSLAVRQHYGLLITKDDDSIVASWFAQNAHFFDRLVCLDGSKSTVTRTVASGFPTVVYEHESSFPRLSATDHGLRAAAHGILVDIVGRDGWVTLCHTDEFFYHDPRKCAERAESEGADGLLWFALHFVPHPNDIVPGFNQALTSPLIRFRHYHWDYNGTGTPWKEFRSFKNQPGIRWEPSWHGSPQPIGCRQIARFHPAYRHYKVYSLDPNLYRSGSGWTEFAKHWQQVKEGRTGLNWEVRGPEDLFVERYEPYLVCSRFDGEFRHPWNIGEEFR